MFEIQARPASLQAQCAEHIEEHALARLRRAGYLELHNIDCTYLDGRLELRGRVSSYYLLQKAQAQVAGVDGVEAIDNRIVVQAARVRADRCG